MIYGEFDLINSQPLTEWEFNANTEKHRLPVGCLYRSDLLKRYKTPYKWIIGDTTLYGMPIPYIHPQGAGTWIKNVIIKDI